MNLLQIRQWVIETTGREELATTVTSQYDTDNGIDKYIAVASQDLDREFNPHNPLLTGEADYFISATLSTNTSENYWSTNFPQALVLATARAIEREYRNTQGVIDYTNAIDDIINGVGEDYATAEVPLDEDSLLNSQMQG
jgi:hypothetical protein